MTAWTNWAMPRRRLLLGLRVVWRTRPPTGAMEPSNEVVQLLTEIRDNQYKQIEAYDAVTKRSLDMQQQAVERQKQAMKMYLRSLVVGGVLVVGIVVLIVYLLRLLG